MHALYRPICQRLDGGPNLGCSHELLPRAADAQETQRRLATSKVLMVSPALDLRPTYALRFLDIRTKGKQEAERGEETPEIPTGLLELDRSPTPLRQG